VAVVELSLYFKRNHGIAWQQVLRRRGEFARSVMKMAGMYYAMEHLFQPMLGTTEAEGDWPN